MAQVLSIPPPLTASSPMLELSINHSASHLEILPHPYARRCIRFSIGYVITTGFAAGGDYANTGGGVNYQCLHREPEYNAYSTGSSYSVISGVEYQSSDDGIFPNAAHDKNVPCARCYTQRSATVMIPSRRSCPSGWSKEYEGME